MATILLVDDDDSLLQVMRIMLKRAGHEVIARSNAREGFAAALNDKVSLIIVDVMMPEVSGYELCTQLKADPRTAHTPVLILTALQDTPMERDYAEDAGADAILTKPVTLDRLSKRLDELLPIGQRSTLK